MDRVFVRYCLVAAASGTLDYILAFLLLHYGVTPPVALAVSIIIAGLAEYAGLEWWGFARRHPGFSGWRLAGSGVAELGTYLIRLGVLSVWRHHVEAGFWENVAGLGLAYAIGFVFGYLFRRRVFAAAGDASVQNDAGAKVE